MDFSETRAIEKEAWVTSYTLAALMMGCAAWTFGALASRISPSWPAEAISAALLFVAAERFYTYHRFKKLEVFSREWVVTLGSLWVVILLVMKLIVGLSGGVPAFLAEVSTYGTAFFENFLTVGFVLAVVLAVITWFVSGYFAELFDEMGFDEALIRRDLVAISQGDEKTVHSRLTGFIFGMGAVLVIFTALVRVDMRVVLQEVPGSWFMELPVLGGGGASTLLYFMLGMALLSQTRFISLNTAWGLHGIRTSREIGKNWAVYSIIFLTLIAIVVSLMPTRYSLGLLDLIAYAIGVVYYVTMFLMQFVVGAIMYFFSLINLLDPDAPKPEMQLPELPEEPLNQLAETPDAGVPWLVMLKSIVSWVLLIGLVAFALAQFLRQNSEFIGALKNMPGGRWLTGVLAWLRKLVGGARDGIRKAVENSLERLRARREAGKRDADMGFLNLRRLDSRQKVYFYYQALIRKSGEIGLNRKLSQTPYEFAATLDKSLPEADTDVDGLTEAFIEARYSRHPVETEQVEHVKTWWEHLRRKLRGTPKPPEKR